MSIEKSQEILEKDIKAISTCKQNLLFVMGRLNHLSCDYPLIEIREIWKHVIETLDEVIVHHLKYDDRENVLENSAFNSSASKPIRMDLLDYFKKDNVSPGETLIERVIIELEQVQSTIVTLYEYYMNGDTFIIDFGEIMAYIKKVKQTLEKI